MVTATTADAIVGYVTAVLDALDRQDAELARRMAALEADGFRLVDGGQEGGDRWSVDDYRTGAVLAAGDGGVEGYHAAWQPDWYHIDRIRTDIDLVDPDRPSSCPAPCATPSSSGCWNTQPTPAGSSARREPPTLATAVARPAPAAAARSTLTGRGGTAAVIRARAVALVDGSGLRATSCRGAGQRSPGVDVPRRRPAPARHRPSRPPRRPTPRDRSAAQPSLGPTSERRPSSPQPDETPQARRLGRLPQAHRVGRGVAFPLARRAPQDQSLSKWAAWRAAGMFAPAASCASVSHQAGHDRHDGACPCSGSHRRARGRCGPWRGGPAGTPRPGANAQHVVSEPSRRDAADAEKR